MIEYWNNLVYELKHYYYNCKHFFLNIIKFRKELSEYRSWDYGYSIMMFTKSLDDIGNNMIKHSPLVNGVKYGRRAKRAAIYLRKAYDGETSEAWGRICDKETYDFIDIPNTDLCKMVVRNPVDKRWKDKVVKDMREQEVRDKKEAWAYVSKHIERFWD